MTAQPGERSTDPHPGGSPVDLVERLVERAALDGSTCLPAPVLAAALRSVGVESPGPVVEQATAAGRVTAHPGEQVVGHPRWSPLEEQLAGHLAEMVARSGPEAVRVLDAPRGSARTDLAVGPEGDPGDDPAAESGDAVVVPDAHRLGLAEAAELLAGLATGDGPRRLVLAGDPAMPYAPGPGRVLADLVASGAFRVDPAPALATGGELDGGSDGEGTGDDQLALVVRGVRNGMLPAVDPSRHEMVVTPADDAERAVHRAVQLVTSSIPKAFGLDAADILVLAPRAAGQAGAGALRVALDAAGATEAQTATTTEGLVEEAQAVVLVLAAEAAGTLTRSMLVGAATQARRHLSVVHQAGPALAEAVARRPHPPRRTRLAVLLADALT